MRVIRATVERTILESFKVAVPDNWDEHSDFSKRLYLEEAHSNGILEEDPEEIEGVWVDYQTLKF